MKIYKRADGFEVQDTQDRDIAWVTETYGGEWVEVIPPPPPTAEELQAIVDAKESKRQAALAKLSALGLTEEDIKAIVL
jgi:hypothetical protein